jgi:ABC-type transport system involved in multi-copper enzyme maturation permease subunit
VIRVGPKVLALAGNTFREGVRDRLFVAVAIFGGVILASSFIIGPLSLGEQARITQDMGLAAISVLSFLIAILIGTGIVYKEIERRTIYTVVAKPVSRWQFIVGKFVGLTATVSLLMGMMTVFLVIVNWIASGGFAPQLLTAVLLTWMELMLLTALSILMSTLSSPILGAIFTLLLYFIGHTSADLKQLAFRFGSNSVKAIVGAVYYALPNLEYLNVRSKVIHEVPVDLQYVAFASSYALLYTVAFLVLAILVFERKEFK